MEIMLDIIVYGLCMHGGGVSDSNGSSDPKAYDLLLGWGCKVPIRCFAKKFEVFLYTVNINGAKKTQKNDAQISYFAIYSIGVKF